MVIEYLSLVFAVLMGSGKLKKPQQNKMNRKTGDDSLSSHSMWQSECYAYDILKETCDIES